MGHNHSDVPLSQCLYLSVRAGLVLLAVDVDLLTFCFFEQPTGQGLKFEAPNQASTFILDSSINSYCSHAITCYRLVRFTLQPCFYRLVRRKSNFCQELQRHLCFAETNEPTFPLIANIFHPPEISKSEINHEKSIDCQNFSVTRRS